MVSKDPIRGSERHDGGFYRIYKDYKRLDHFYGGSGAFDAKWELSAVYPMDIGIVGAFGSAEAHVGVVSLEWNGFFSIFCIAGTRGIL